jgi:hypothetical protein
MLPDTIRIEMGTDNSTFTADLNIIQARYLAEQITFAIRTPMDYAVDDDETTNTQPTPVAPASE